MTRYRTDKILDDQTQWKCPW